MMSSSANKRLSQSLKNGSDQPQDGATEPVHDLPRGIEARMLALAVRGRAANESGDVAGAAELFNAAWECIPEPKETWDWTGTLATGLLDFHLEHGHVVESRRWLREVQRVYGADPTAEFFRARVLHASGAFDDAARVFHELYQAWGHRPFDGEDDRYWKFYCDSRFS